MFSLYFLLYQVDIFQKDLLLIPIHLEVHWSLISVDIPRRAITYFDSQRTLNRRCPKVRVGRSGWLGVSGIKTFFCFFRPPFPAYFQVSASGGRQKRKARLLDWMERLFQNGQTLHRRHFKITHVQQYKGFFFLLLLCIQIKTQTVHGWSVVGCVLQNVGRQNNDSDCGAFVLQVRPLFRGSGGTQFWLKFKGCRRWLISYLFQISSWRCSTASVWHWDSRSASGSRICPDWGGKCTKNSVTASSPCDLRPLPPPSSPPAPATNSYLMWGRRRYTEMTTGAIIDWGEKPNPSLPLSRERPPVVDIISHFASPFPAF